jgi:hypothetical protein
MALLQAAKNLFPLRQRFYARHLARWLSQQAAKVELVGEAAAQAAQLAEEDLILLATCGDRPAFYEVPAEQLSALFAGASQIVIDEPHRYKDLLLCLAPLASGEDLHVLLNPPVATAEEPASSDREQRYLDARARIGRQMQRSTDALLISIAYRWQKAMQLSALTLNALILWSAMFWYSTTSSAIGRPSVTTLPGAVVLALLGAIGGGVLAPVARDLVAVLEELRGKPSIGSA